MRRSKLLFFFVILVTGVECTQLSTAFSQSHYTGYLEQEDANRVAAMRQAGLHNDRTQIPQIVATLQNPMHPAYTYTSIHTLAQMGSESSLSEIERYIRHNDTEKDKDLDLSNFVLAAKARLLAESRTQSITDSRMVAAVKVHNFFAQLGLSPFDLNSDLTSYNSPQSTSNPNGKDTYILSNSVKKVHPVGVYATRELADMVYHGRYEDFALLPEVNAVDFSQDYASALKVRLAQMPRENRLAAMIQELSHRTSLSFNDYYEIQLAINEGTDASEAAASELRKMDRHREQYNQIAHHSGFTAMFQILWGVGDKRQAPLLAYFKADANHFVAHYADIMHDDVLQGVKRESELAY